MEVVHQNCAGLDVHKRTVTGCVITPENRETRSFGTTTSELLALRSWLADNGVTHVAMESTGVYWKPVADLLRHGLLTGSFIPDRTQRELRELVRYRRSLIGEQARETNRIQKVLEGANVKLGDVTSVILGVSARRMLKALIAGQTDPGELADLARGRLRSKRDALKEALTGLMGPHQRWMLAAQLAHVEFLEGQIAQLDHEIAIRMGPFEEILERMGEVDGLARRTSEEILAEIGVDMSRFPTAGHLASWAKICPGNNESAGRRKSGQIGKGNAHLQSALVRAAQAASHTRDTYLAAQYRRLAARRGKNRAKVAVAHTILVIVYHIIKHGTRYYNLGADHFDRLKEQATVDRLLGRLQGLGYTVTLEKSTSAA